MQEFRPMIIALDFDGTIVKDAFSKIGEFNWDLIAKALIFKSLGAELVLWTCREEKYLAEAVEKCRIQGLEFDSINENTPSMIERMKSFDHKMGLRKIYADMYVDDKAIGSIEHFLSLDPFTTMTEFRASQAEKAKRRH